MFLPISPWPRAKFKARFGENETLSAQHRKVGDMVVQKVQNRTVLHLVTKQSQDDKSKLPDFIAAVQSLKIACADHKISKLAIPKI